MTDRSEPGSAANVSLLRALAVLAALGMAAGLFFFWFWYTGVRPRAIDIDSLAPRVKRELIDELMYRSPGLYTPSLFAPELGYTLKPNQRLTAWGSSFTANALGYRTGPPEKAPGVVRILFVGDSWTFGVGVDEKQSFPAMVASLANQFAGGDRPVEAFNLALPGYNIMNGLAALDVFLDRLQPAAVVLCPTMNDIDSASSILPNGSQVREGVTRDAFGSSHALRFRAQPLDSHLCRLRWRMAAARMRKTEEWLGQLGVPTLIYFAAGWNEAVVHSLVEEGGLTSPYVVTPLEFVGPEWRNPAPVLFGTPAACRVYASMAYRGLSGILGWNLLPAAEQGPIVSVHRRPPPGAWAIERDELFARVTAAEIPTTFTPSPEAAAQVLGPMDVVAGLVGRGTTVLVRRAQGARRLVVAVKADVAVPSLYPMQLTVSIPSPSGGTRVVTSVPRDASTPQRFELPIPDDLPPGRALDVIFEAERGGISGNRLELRSFYLLSIVQAD